MFTKCLILLDTLARNLNSNYKSASVSAYSCDWWIIWFWMDGNTFLTAGWHVRSFNGNEDANTRMNFSSLPLPPTLHTMGSIKLATWNLRFDSMPDSITVQQSLDNFPGPLDRPSEFNNILPEMPWSTRRIKVAQQLLDEDVVIAGNTKNYYVDLWPETCIIRLSRGIKKTSWWHASALASEREPLGFCD